MAPMAHHGPLGSSYLLRPRDPGEAANSMIKLGSMLPIVQSAAEAAAKRQAREAAVAKKNNEEKILVAIRMRPVNKKEASHAQVWKVLPKYSSVKQTTPEGLPLPERGISGRTLFTFDKAFGIDASTKQVYDDVAKHIVSSALSGLNGTVFAYGQTSSGKTYTMQGDQENKGVVHLAATDIFNHIQRTRHRNFLITCSYLEIYNEEVRDLLAAVGSEDASKPLPIREDRNRNVFVPCKQERVTGYEDLSKILVQGEKSRIIGSTAMNERSSRSHTIFRITIESRKKKNSLDKTDKHEEIALASTLNLVDLAGSESVRSTGASGERRKEGGKINQSLLALSRVIEALGSPHQQLHINYRDSKLTRILQPSLSGNARLAVICCATTSELYIEETRSTFLFASRAKLVKTWAQVNEINDERSLIKNLQRELAESKERKKTWTGAKSQQSILAEQASLANGRLTPTLPNLSTKQNGAPVRSAAVASAMQTLQREKATVECRDESSTSHKTATTVSSASTMSRRKSPNPTADQRDAPSTVLVPPLSEPASGLQGAMKTATNSLTAAASSALTSVEAATSKTLAFVHEAKHEQLQQDKQRLHEALETEKSRVDRLQSVVRDLRGKLVETQKKLEDEQAKVEEAQKVADWRKEENKLLVEKYKAELARARQERSKVHNLTHALDEAVNVATKERQRADEAAARAEQTKMELERTRAELAAMKAKVAELEHELGATRQDNQQLAEELVDAKEELQKSKVQQLASIQARKVSLHGGLHAAKSGLRSKGHDSHWRAAPQYLDESLELRHQVRELERRLLAVMQMLRVKEARIRKLEEIKLRKERHAGMKDILAFLLLPLWDCQGLSRCGCMTDGAF